MYFDTKSYLKSTRNHTAKHALKVTIGFALIMDNPTTNRLKTLKINSILV